MRNRIGWITLLVGTGLGLVLGLGGAPAARASASATIAVTTTDDELNSDGDCALREAIAAANTDSAVDACPAGNGADTINLPSGTYTLTLVGLNDDTNATGDLDLTEDVVLNGAGSSATIIDGNGSVTADRVLHILGPAAVTLSGVQVRNGQIANSGGGLAVEAGSALTLTASRVSDNWAAGGIYNRGGGIRSNGRLVLINSEVVNNHNTGLGGGLSSTTNVQVISSTIAYNQAGGGGGLYLELGVADISDSAIVSNTATASWLDTGGGGGLQTQALTTIRNSIISHNVVSATDTSGGGVLNGDRLIVDTSLISDNHAHFGGGVYISNNGEVKITRSTIRGNTANDSGGGLYSSAINSAPQSSIIASTLVDNAAIHGGGLFLSNGGPFVLLNSTVSHNTAAENGGGVVFNWPVTFKSSTIVSNTADSDGDGTGNGGGIYGYVFGWLTAQNVIVADNIDGSPVPEHPDCSGTGKFVSDDFNLIENTVGCQIIGVETHNVYGQDPLVGPLQDNGGGTLTHALLANSPAIEAGNPAGCTNAAGLGLILDQRQYLRAADGDGNSSVICDIGAYEDGAVLPIYVYVPILHK